MAEQTVFDEREVSGDNGVARSILAPFTRPRKTVENWGIHRCMGIGVENFKDPWYYHRPVFNHLWQNAYLGVGEDGAKSVERYYIPKQHLYYLSLLLHRELLQEKYVQAAYTLVAISQNPQSLPEQIWRCGMEVLKQCPSSLMGTKRKFYKLMSSLCPQYSNEMVIDMAFQILNNGNDAREAYQFLVSNINNKRVKYDVIFRAYIGMFEYVLWKIDLDKAKESNAKGYAGKSFENISTESMSFNAKRALESMRIVLYENGIWDCIVLKMLEILDYYNNMEEAVSILETYRNKNMDNPNAHRYLYLYLKKTNQKLDTHFDVLNDLIKLDITNNLAHEFFEMLKSKGEHCQVLELLFQRLDHFCCKDNEDDWQMLFVLIKKFKKHPSSAEWRKIRDCMSERAAWWPKYHFTLINKASFQERMESDQKVVRLSKYKRKIASYLEIKDSRHEKLGIYSPGSMASDAECAASDSSSTASHCRIGVKRSHSRSLNDLNHLAKRER